MLAILLFLLGFGIPLIPARLLQVFISTSYCVNTAIFSCYNEDSSNRNVMWDLRNGEVPLYSGSFLGISHTTTTTQIGHSNITVEITFRNSSFLTTTLTITNISSLVPVTVVCNGERREIHHDPIIPDIFQFSFELLQTSNNTALYWNLTWEVYYIKELSSSDEVIGASSINNISSLPYFMHNNATKLKISMCSEEHKGFTIEQCVFTEANHAGIENKYTILRDNLWLLTCSKTSQTFNTSCSSNGKWKDVPCRVPNYPTDSQSIDNEISDYNYGSALFPPQFGNISEVNSTRSLGIISFILVASMVPVVFILFTTSMVVIFTPTRMWYCNKGKGLCLNNSHFLEEAEVIKNIIILSPSGMYHNIFYRTKQESNSVPVIIIILMLMQAQEICRKWKNWNMLQFMNVAKSNLLKILS